MATAAGIVVILALTWLLARGTARSLWWTTTATFAMALLITAAMGAMVLAHRERWKPHATQRDLSVARFKDGGHPGNLPNPGVYARHNAVDTPAILPDGIPIQPSSHP